MATHSSVLAWRIPGTAEPGGLPSMGSHRVGHDWSDLAGLADAGDTEDVGLIPGWGRSPGEGNGSPLQYSGKFCGQRSLVGYSPRGCRESDSAEQLNTEQTWTLILRRWLFSSCLGNLMDRDASFKIVGHDLVTKQSKQHFLLKSHKPTSANFKLFFCSFLTCLSLHRIEDSEDFLWIRLWMKGMLWLVSSSIQTTWAFSIATIRLFRFLIICEFTGAALWISFENFSFALTTWLTVWCKRPHFQPVSVSEMPSLLSLIISSFWCKSERFDLKCDLSVHLNA